MDPDVLGLLITSKCNITCRHCCNDSHPKQTGVVPFEELARLIEMASEMPSIREIGISGGEPFLYIPLLKRVVYFAASRGFSSSVTTNGFWAKSPERAREFLADLRACGLRALSISTSVFHQEFLDLSTVVDAAYIALDVGLAVTINYVSTSSMSVEVIRCALGELTKKVEIIEMPCLPTGRGATRVHKNEFDRQFPVPHGNCRMHFKKFTVDSSGNVYPCCSPGGFTRPLLMGNAKDSSLRSIFENSQHNKLLAILESVGPQFFLPFLRAASVDPPIPERFSDICHLCNTILSSDSYATIIQDAAEQLFSELAALGSDEIELTGGRLAKLVRLHQSGRPVSLEVVDDKE